MFRHTNECRCPENPQSNGFAMEYTEHTDVMHRGSVPGLPDSNSVLSSKACYLPCFPWLLLLWRESEDIHQIEPADVGAVIQKRIIN
jgi:hypothetical protein